MRSCRHRAGVGAMSGIVVLATGPSASAALYRGSGDGLRFVFRTRGEELVGASISGSLRCREEEPGSGGKRSRSPFGRRLATAADPLRPDRHGRFHFVDRPALQPEDEEIEEAFFLHIIGSQALGSYEYRRGEFYAEPWRTCQTGFFPSGDPLVRFRALRVGR